MANDCQNRNLSLTCPGIQRDSNCFAGCCKVLFQRSDIYQPDQWFGGVLYVGADVKGRKTPGRSLKICWKAGSSMTVNGWVVVMIHYMRLCSNAWIAEKFVGARGFFSIQWVRLFTSFIARVCFSLNEWSCLVIRCAIDKCRSMLLVDPCRFSSVVENEQRGQAQRISRFSGGFEDPLGVHIFPGIAITEK